MLIDQLPEITTANDADEMPIEQGTTTRKIKILNLLKGVVKKAGDTMSGRLNVESAINSATYFNAKNTAYSLSDLPSGFDETIYSLVVQDKANNNIGYVRNFIKANGSTTTELVARNLVNGSGYTNSISLTMGPDGTRDVSVTSPSAWRSALGVPLYTEGTWTPKLYDYNTFKQDLPSQSYFKIGNYYVMLIRITVFPTTTFETMIQIRNTPCATVDGGIVYAGAANGAGAEWTVQGAAGGSAYLRPNFVGTLSGGVFQMVIFGHD